MFGERVVLRAHLRSDLAVLQPILREDVATVALMEDAAWVPRSLASVEARFDRRLSEDPTGEEVWFVVQKREDPEACPIGEAGLWGVDLHRRQAHLGLVLGRDCRGAGLGRDVIRVLCDYAFRVRGLHRLQADTLTLNSAMREAACATGFREEGVLREAAWYDGAYVDGLVLGLLDRDWWGSPAERQQSEAGQLRPDAEAGEGRS